MGRNNGHIYIEVETCRKYVVSSTQNVEGMVVLDRIDDNYGYMESGGVRLRKILSDIEYIDWVSKNLFIGFID